MSHSKTRLSLIWLGGSLNGTINIDKTNFIKVNLNNTKFDFNGIKLAQSNLQSDKNNLSLRFIGKIFEQKIT